MTEIFADISDNVRNKADIIWRIAINQPSPAQAAKFLNDITEYYRMKWTEEEVDFLQFYFQTQMEMVKK